LWYEFSIYARICLNIILGYLIQFFKLIFIKFRNNTLNFLLLGYLLLFIQIFHFNSYIINTLILNYPTKISHSPINNSILISKFLMFVFYFKVLYFWQLAFKVKPSDSLSNSTDLFLQNLDLNRKLIGWYLSNENTFFINRTQVIQKVKIACFNLKYRIDYISSLFIFD